MDIQPQRADLALELGLMQQQKRAMNSPGHVISYSAGHGVDAVLITAIQKAMRGRIRRRSTREKVLSLPWISQHDDSPEDLLREELDFPNLAVLWSGRYDSKYEEKGMTIHMVCAVDRTAKYGKSIPQLIAHGKVNFQASYTTVSDCLMQPERMTSSGKNGGKHFSSASDLPRARRT